MPRDRLVAAITAAADARLILVIAPAGSGKTTLLSEWRVSPEEERPFAWLSLDAADNDPVRLFEGVVAALRTVDPDLGAAALGYLAGPTSLTGVVLPSLINDLVATPRPLVLAFDDYHVIRNPRIHDALDYLLEHLPDTVQIAIASRAEPPLPIGRLRVRRQLVEVRRADLRFTDDEAGALLAEALGFDLDPVDLARLQERTEGWAAGLQLAALSLGGREDPHDFISGFAGDDRPIVDYLGYEVLDGQPSEVREFLLLTSVLDRLTGPLCDAVTGGQGRPARSISSSSPGSSSSRSTPSGSGTAATTCSASCFAKSSGAPSRSSCRSCIAAPLPGTASTTAFRRRSTTQPRVGTWARRAS